MREAIKKILQKRNVWLHGKGSLPKGVSLWLDLKRYGYLQHIGRMVDVGANVGTFTQEALNHIEGLNVDCIEPVEDTYDQLVNNLSTHASVTCHHCACGSQPSALTIELEEASTFNSLNKISTEVEPGKRTEKINVLRLDDLITVRENEQIGLLKTDTEGYDLKVLHGAEAFFQSQQVLLVLSEVGFNEGDSRHTPFIDIFPFLRGHGFDVFGFYDQARWWANHALDYANVLFVHRETAAKLLSEDGKCNP